MRPLLETACGFLGRRVTPAVLVALAVCRPGEVGELVSEGPLAELCALLGQPEPVLIELEVALLREADQEGAECRRRNGQESGKLRRGRALGQSFGAHP